MEYSRLICWKQKFSISLLHLNCLPVHRQLRPPLPPPPHRPLPPQHQMTDDRCKIKAERVTRPMRAVVQGAPILNFSAR